MFGQEYDEKRFDRTLHAANLEDDIKVLPGGVLTEIGEKLLLHVNINIITMKLFCWQSRRVDVLIKILHRN